MQTAWRVSGPLLSLIALGLLFTTACGGGALSFIGASKSNNGQSQPNSDSPLPPVATTGAYLTGVLVDENGVALGNALITLADGTRVQSDSDGKFKIPFSESLPSAISLSIETGSGKTAAAEIKIPEDVRTSTGPTMVARVVKISVTNNGSVTATSVSTSAPVIKGFNPSSALKDNLLSRIEITSLDLTVSQSKLFAIDSVGGVQTQHALIAQNQNCDTNTVFDRPSMPIVADLASYDLQSLRVCVKQTSADSAETFAQSPVFTIAIAPRSLIGLTNDSDGAFARFFWSDPDPQTPTLRVTLAYGDNLSVIDSWDGLGSPMGITLVTNFADCSDVNYRTNDSGPLAAAGKCGFNLSGKSAWSKLFFKLHIEKANMEYLSPRMSSAHVPSGMVLVAKEDWPTEYSISNNANHYDGNAVGGGYGPFDYAIDKYEASLADGTGDGSSQSLSIYNFGASSPNSLKLISQPSNSTDALSAYNWYSFKQGCENRSADLSSFVDAGNARRKVHLATDLEWFVASAGTPDKAGAPYCNIDGTSPSPLKPGDTASSLCVSKFGARDMIGNLIEWTDGLWDSTAGITRVTFAGTPYAFTNAMPLPNAGAAIKTQDKFVTGWDYLFSFVSTLGTTASTQFNSDQYTNIANGASNVGSLRGGHYKNTAGGSGAAGRHTLWLSYLAAYSSGFASMNFIGGRCALVAPMP